MRRILFFIIFLAISVLYNGSATAEETDEDVEIAKKLANPLSNMICVPLQYNYDKNMGADGTGTSHLLNIQPVIPFSLNDKWNLITRTIIPIADSDGIIPGKHVSGLGDIQASQFFSPKHTDNGWIWGVGVIELLPSATNDILGEKQWGLGPTAAVLRQKGPVTIGLLTNHIWSISGDDDHSDISSTYIQPFFSYIFVKTKTTVGISVESTYDWISDQWSVPVIFTVSQLLKSKDQMYQVSLGARYWASSPDNGAEGWGFRAQLTLLFPKK